MAEDLMDEMMDKLDSKFINLTHKFSQIFLS